MTTFQATVYAILHGFTEFLPISAPTHDLLVPYIVSWQVPTQALIAALELGALFAVLIFFRHDWASIFSSFLQILIFRRKPMTLDERLPFFLVLSSAPPILLQIYLRDTIRGWEWNALKVAGVFSLIGVGLWILDTLNRRIKGMFDWNWKDALLVGVLQCLWVLPGGDALSGAWLAILFLNYQREPGAKYAFYSIAPILTYRVFHSCREINFSGPGPEADLSWISFGVALVVTLFTSLLAIGGFLRQVQQKGMKQFVIYRWILALSACLLFWFRNR